MRGRATQGVASHRIDPAGGALLHMVDPVACGDVLRTKEKTSACALAVSVCHGPSAFPLARTPGTALPVHQHHQFEEINR